MLRRLRAFRDRRAAGWYRRRGIVAVVARLAQGGVLLLSPTDRKITPQVLAGHGWQQREFANFEAYVHRHGMPQACFVDVGANVGTHSVYACRSGCFEQVVAIEPNPTLEPLLRANLALHAGRKPCHVLIRGAHEAHGELVLSLNLGNVGGATLGSKRTANERHRVPVGPLDDMLSDLGLPAGAPLALWMDVESHEAAALRGATGLLATRRVALCVEIRPRRVTPQSRAFLDGLLGGARDLCDAATLAPITMPQVWASQQPHDLLALFDPAHPTPKP